MRARGNYRTDRTYGSDRGHRRHRGRGSYRTDRTRGIDGTS